MLLQCNLLYIIVFVQFIEFYDFFFFFFLPMIIYSIASSWYLTGYSVMLEC